MAVARRRLKRSELVSQACGDAVSVGGTTPDLDKVLDRSLIDTALRMRSAGVTPLLKRALGYRQAHEAQHTSIGRHCDYAFPRNEGAVIPGNSAAAAVSL